MGASTGFPIYALKSILIAIIAALLIEIAFFNYEALESRTFSEVSPSGKVVLNENDASEAVIEYAFSEGASVKNVRIENNASLQTISLFIRDEGNSLYYSIGTVAVEGAETIRVHPYGDLLGIKLVPEESGAVSGIDCSFNQQKPFDINGQRLSFLVVIALSFLLIASKSPLRYLPYNTPFLIIGTAGVMALLGLVLVLRAYDPSTFTDPSYEHHHQYFELVVALSEGHVWLNQTPSQELIAMSNPYDTAARVQLGVDYLWDHAYYDGKYYVYFGVLPALVFHLPYYLLTGQELPNAAGIAVSISMFSIGLVLLIKAIMDRWFPHSSAYHFLACYFIAYLSSWVMQCARTPYLYVLPIALSLALVVWGLYFWIKAISSEKIRLLPGIAGSFCMSAVLLCRPQFLAFSILGIFLALDIVVLGKGNRKSNIVRVLALLAPYIIIGVAAGGYNYARFGSALDFGANYNLTSNDMTHRGFEAGRIPLGLFSYLVQPPSIDLLSPVFDEVSVASSYYGNTITQTMHGGVFALLPVLCLVVLLPLLKGKSCGSPTPWIISLASLLSAIVVVIFDTNGAGILTRYHCDYGLLIGLSAALAFLMLAARLRCDADCFKEELCCKEKLDYCETIVCAVVNVLLVYSLAAAILCTRTLLLT